MTWVWQNCFVDTCWMNRNLPARLIWHSVEVVVVSALLFYRVCRLFLEEWRSITGVSVLLATRCDRLNRSDPIIIAIITEEYLCVCLSLILIINAGIDIDEIASLLRVSLLIISQNRKKSVHLFNSVLFLSLWD